MNADEIRKLHKEFLFPATINYYKDVARAIAAYYTDPVGALGDLEQRASKL